MSRIRKDIRRNDLLVSSANETLRIEDSIAGIHGSLVFCGITNETLLSREGDVRRCGSVTLWMIAC